MILYQGMILELPVKSTEAIQISSDESEMTSANYH